MRKFTTWLIWLGLSIFPCAFPALAQSPQLPGAQVPQPVILEPQSGALTASGLAALPARQAPEAQAAGRISGSVVDQTGAVVAGARVRLTRDALSPAQETLTDDAGQFFFFDVQPGAFQLAVAADGFAPHTSSGLLQSGQSYSVPQIALVIAASTDELRVLPSQVEVAEDQIKVEEKQRVLGVIPNFYVTYDHHAAPLAPRQKFELAWKATIDPVNFGITGLIAGIQQSQNDFSGYGQGAAGYGRRYGAAYGNFLTGTYIGAAILPSLLKQDPRYFYKGTGTTRSRVLYALANAVICKGDDGRWEVNYSSIIGNLASGGISNLYYPAKNRDGAELTFENALINIGATAATNLLQEFLIKRFTPSVAKHVVAAPQNSIGEPSPIPMRGTD